MRLAVVLFCYKRPRTLKRVLKTHKKLDGVDYYCFIDKSKVENEIFSIIYNTFYETITIRPYNFGLNRNILSGISEVFNMGYDAVIVLEDDLLIAEDGFDWLKMRLEYFQGDDRYGAISLSKGKVLNEQFRCWGWGTWKHVWGQIDWSKLTNESWDVFLAKWMKDNQLYTRCGEKNRVKHIGYFGTHYSWYSGLSIRKYYRKWKEDYYRDKDLLMQKEKFIHRVFRFISNL